MVWAYLKTFHLEKGYVQVYIKIEHIRAIAAMTRFYCSRQLTRSWSRIAERFVETFCQSIFQVESNLSHSENAQATLKVTVSEPNGVAVLLQVKTM